MRDESERDEIREKHAGRPGVGHHVERLMGERENAEAYGQDERARQIDEQLAGFGYKTARARKADAERRAAAEKPEGDVARPARRQVPAERKAPADRQVSGG